MDSISTQSQHPQAFLFQPSLVNPVDPLFKVSIKYSTHWCPANPIFVHSMFATDTYCAILIYLYKSLEIAYKYHKCAVKWVCATLRNSEAGACPWSFLPAQ